MCLEFIMSSICLVGYGTSLNTIYMFRPAPTPRQEEVGQYGVDKETQIYPNDPHLFDFDKEVRCKGFMGDPNLV